MNKLLLGLFVLTSQNQISQTQSASSNDPDRPYSTFDTESNEHKRLLTPPFGDFIARITQYNLESLKFFSSVIPLCLNCFLDANFILVIIIIIA
ncbi:MAG: hypothetical protein EBT55_04395 [Proteobacteria bacterium]|nr:hypothetical protein [Pseudomonadota bacterium]